MAPLPKTNTINHFTHPGHPLKPVDNNEEYKCDGCKTTGIGKRYRCHGCDFDLHDYCGKCPRALSSFMHNHSLTLVIRKAQQNLQVNRICDICTDPVEGLFYRCKECEFDVHPLCTQLPEKLQHALDKIHPLILESPRIAGLCTVCRGSCNGWRYRCRICKIDIHLECVLVPVVQSQQNSGTSQRGVPFQPPPIFAPYYGFGPGYPNFGPGYPNFGPGYPNYGPGYPNYGPGFNMYNNGYPQNFGQQNQQVSASNSGTGKFQKSMFSLVGQLGFGVISNMIFGVDVSSLFSGLG